MKRCYPSLLLLACAILFTLLLRALHLPGSWMFGPLAVSAIFAVRGWQAVRFPNAVYVAGQAVIGTALGAGFAAKTLFILLQHLGIFSFAVVFILLASLFNGWLLARYTRLDSGTAFLGTMPGGASAMAAMSDSLKANTQLVTAIQYARLLLILGSLACVAPIFRAYAHPASSAATALLIVAPSEFVAWKFFVLVLIAGLGWLAGTRTRIPASAFLVPLIAYTLFGLTGQTLGGWPWPILAAAYGIMGLQIGGRFHPSTIALIRNVILPVIGTTVSLLVASLLLAWIVSREMGLDFVSAYLAATPGGLDSVAAVATELHIDTTVIVAMHMVRLLCVLLLGPWLVKASVRGMAGDAIPQGSV